MMPSAQLRNTVESVYNTATQFDSKSGQRLPSLKRDMLYRLSEQFADCSDTFPNDALMQVLLYVLPALRAILHAPREKMRRETEMVAQTRGRICTRREISWLSARPGRTVREKIASSPHLLAEKKRYSADTLENRALAYLLRRLFGALQERIRLAGALSDDSRIVHALQEFHDLYRQFRRSELWELPAEYPQRVNNVLISDKHYSKVRRACMMLRQYMQREEWDAENKASLFVQSAALLAAAELFAREKVRLFDHFSMWRLEEESSVPLPIRFLVTGTDGAERCLELSADGSSLIVSVAAFSESLPGIFRPAVEQETCSYDITAADTAVQAELPDERVLELSPGTDAVRELAKEMLAGCCEMAHVSDTVTGRTLRVLPQEQTAILDFSSNYLRKTVRELCDFACFDNDMDGLSILPDERCLYGALDFSFTKLDDLLDHDAERAEGIHRLLTQYAEVIGTDGMFTYLVADNVDAFEQMELRKNITSHFRSNSFPVWRSVAAAEGLRSSGKWELRKNIHYLIVDTDAAGCPITLLRVRDDGSLEHYIPDVLTETDSILSENRFAREYLVRYLHQRHLDLLIREDMYTPILNTGIINQLVRGVYDDSGARKQSLYLYTRQTQVRLDIYLDEQIMEELVQEARNVVRQLLKPRLKKEKAAFPIYLCSRPQMEKMLFSERTDRVGYCVTDPDLLLYGAQVLSQRFRSGSLTWHEHLPSLSLMIPQNGRYHLLNLIGTERSVSAAIGGETIHVQEKMLLPPGSRSYEFPLITEVLGGKRQYTGIVASSAFPLKEAVRVEMEIHYHYGSEDTYELLLHPIGTGAPFRELRVEWVIPDEKLLENQEVTLPEPRPAQMEQVRSRYAAAREFTNKGFSILQNAPVYFRTENQLRSTQNYLGSLWILAQIYSTSADEAAVREAKELLDEGFDEMDDICADIVKRSREEFPEDSVIYQNEGQIAWIRQNCEYILALFAGICEECAGKHYFLNMDLTRIKNSRRLSFLYQYCLTFALDDDLWAHYMRSFTRLKREEQYSVLRSMSVMFWKNPDIPGKILEEYPEVLDTIADLLFRRIKVKQVRPILQSRTVQRSALLELRDMMELLLAVLRLRTRGFARFAAGSREALSVAQQIKLIDMEIGKLDSVDIEERRDHILQGENLSGYFDRLQRVHLHTEAPEVLSQMTKLSYALVVYLTGDYGADSISITDLDFSEDEKGGR